MKNLRLLSERIQQTRAKGFPHGIDPEALRIINILSDRVIELEKVVLPIASHALTERSSGQDRIGIPVNQIEAAYSVMAYEYSVLPKQETILYPME